MIEWLGIPYENLSAVATIDLYVQTVARLKEAHERLTEVERKMDFHLAEDEKR